jgi:prepilin-type N-terminal cleavage/methylation domain-containing protein
METAMRQSNYRIGPAQLGQGRQPARGFTLIEVMVVLALTLVMMAAFAQIFSMTGTFVAKQKGVGENDQCARILTTVLKNDLQNRTMRYVAPFHPNMAQLPSETSRLGYFEYSENNPLDDTDDVLQFTIQVPFTNPITNLPNPPLYGTATFLPKQVWQANTAYVAGTYVLPPAGAQTGFIYCATVAGTSGGGVITWPTTLLNTVIDGTVTWKCVDSTLQADGDDGVVFPLTTTPVVSTALLPQPAAAGVYPTFPGVPPTAYTTNNTGASEYAEVSYFLRHGNLCRRFLLIRQPYNSTGTTQPGAATLPIINGAYAAAPPFVGTPAINGNFWTDFDYAARFDNASTTPTLAPLFFGLADLNNFTLTQYPLGRPDSRFGHDQTSTLLTTLGTAAAWPTVLQTGNGAPREYDSNGVFLGRYTHEETSNNAFEFPGAIPLAGSPMAQATPALTINTTPGAPNVGSVTAFSGGPRRGEDILLTNVLSFDVKIWDGHYSETTFDANRNGIIDSGPAFADVGHNAATGDFLQGNNALPTYGPHASQAQNAGATANMYTVGNVSYFNNIFDTWCRAFDFDNVPKNYDVADSPPAALPPLNLYAAAPYRPRIGVTWQQGVSYTAGTLVDPVNTANGYVYKCMTPGTSAAPPAGQPDPFSLTDQTITPNTINDGTTGLTWNALPPLAVQAIQIKVKYLDPSQNLLRQVTIVQSLTP